MRGLHFPPRHLDAARVVDERLGDVDAVAVAFREAEGDADGVLGGGGADEADFGAGEGEGVFDVFDAEVEVYGAGPEGWLVVCVLEIEVAQVRTEVWVYHIQAG